MKTRAFLLGALVLTFSCKERGTNNQNESIDRSHLPLRSLLEHDLKEADEIAGGILLKTVDADQKDSTYTDHGTFKKMASAFLRPELDPAFFQDHYEESSLMDETTGMVNFIYTPVPDNTALRKVIVYIKPGLSNDQVKKVYMEIEKGDSGRTTSLKMTWKMKAYFMIAESRIDGGGTERILVKKAIWNPEYFSEE